VAYDVPLSGEEPLTPGHQLSRSYRELQQLFGKQERELREQRRK
jgi:hypothetical protein